MASKKRGPYDGTSRTSKWRKLEKEEEHESNVDEIAGPETIDDLTDCIDEVPNEYDILVEEMLEEEKQKLDQKSSDNQSDIENQPLYQGSRLTVSMSMLLIVTFATRHNLSGVALCDLLNLLEVHCPSDNICRATLTMYQDFFRKLKTPLIYNHFCDKCFLSIEKDAKCETCPNCSSTSIRYFITIPLKDQMETILKRPGVLDMIRKSKIERSELGNTSTIEDVYNGNVYQSHFDISGFFHGTTLEERKHQLHLSFQINTDGVAVFKSSKFGVWPVYAVINELPPDARFTRENRIFLGLWFGTQKPNMKLLFGSFLKEFNLLSIGIPMSIKEEQLTVKAVLLSSTADAPARCLMMDFVQFNGKYGCPCCLSPGETFAISATGNSHIYPYKSESNEGHDKLRTKEETKATAHRVETEYLSGRRRDPVPEMGVKGISFLMSFPKFDLIKGTGIDYMHCVLLGVVKMILGLWIDLDHKNEQWSLRSHVDVLNDRIKKLRPHCMISRLPKKIDEYGDWKASEFRTFLLYYSVPLLEDVLPSKYFDHFCNLVLGTFLLLKTSISQTDLNLARCCFKRFCIGIEELYTERYATFNVHCLLHLCTKVEDLGPLWSQSCFFYEGLNGDLRNLFHGTQKIDLQIVTAVCIQNKIPELVDKLEIGSVKSFYQKMQSSLQSFTRTCIGLNTFVVGPIKAFLPEEHVIQLLKNKFRNVAEYHIFYRVLYNKVMYYSEEYNPVKKRNSYTCKNKSGICQIRYFLQCSTENGYKYVAVTRILNVQKSCANVCQVSIGLTNVVLVDDLREPVMYIDIDERKKQVAFFPNLIEKD